MQKLYTWLTREDGQTMAEYGVVLSVIAIAVLGALALLSGGIVNALTRVAGYVEIYSGHPPTPSEMARFRAKVRFKPDGSEGSGPDTSSFPG